MHSKLKTAADLFSVSTFQTQWKHWQNSLESHTIMKPRSNLNHTKNITTQVLLIFFPPFFLCKRKKTFFFLPLHIPRPMSLSLSSLQISLSFFCVIEHIYSTLTVHFSATCVHVFWKFYWGSNKEVVKANYDGWTWMNKVYGFGGVWITGVVGTWTKKKNPPLLPKKKSSTITHTPPNNKTSKVLLLKNKNPSQSQS